jgi:Flp pilus assembly protein TadG
MRPRGCRGFSSSRRQRGAAAIEFALTITVLLMLMVGLIGYGVVFWMQQKLTKAAGEGAQAVLLAAQQGELRRAALESLACLSVRREALRFSDTDADGAQRIGCTPVFGPCTWTMAGAVTAPCVSIRVAYDPAGWPLMATMRNLSQALSGSSTWFPSSLTANAVVQIPQVPQEPAT